MGVQEDVKAGLCELAEAHGADLLLIGHAHSSRLRKTFTTSTASHLAHHAPCPTLIIPYKFLGLEPAHSEVRPGPDQPYHPSITYLWGTRYLPRQGTACVMPSSLQHSRVHPAGAPR